MAVGPNVEKLRHALSGTKPESITLAADEWEKARGILEDVALYLKKSSPQMRWAIGGETGPAVDDAFTRSAEAMQKRAEALKKGVQALEAARLALDDAEAAKGEFKDIDQPTPVRAPTSGATDEELKAEAQSKGREAKAAKALADQEEQARIAHEALMKSFEESSEAMKQIHGEPDPPPPPPPPATNGPGVGNGGSGNGPTGHAIWVPQQTAHFVVTDDGHTNTHWQPPHEPPVHYVPNPPQHETNVPTGGTVDPGTGNLPEFNGNPIGGQVSGSTTGGGPGLGAAGATAGGMAAGLLGAKLTGALKGGLFPGSGAAGTAGRGTAASAVRGIGSSGRTGGAGTLGRSGAAAGSGAAGRSGAAGAGQGAGRSGAGQGAGRSGAGGRGGAGRSGSGGRGGAGAGGRTGAGPTGRTGRSKDEEDGKKRELFDAGEDWVDDEGAAPGVLD